MILEIATLLIRAGNEENFEKDFFVAGQYICAVKGYMGHSLQKCMEQQNKYVLLVRWENLDAHITGFRQSPGYTEWKRMLHHYYDPFPVVEHYEMVFQNGE